MMRLTPTWVINICNRLIPWSLFVMTLGLGVGIGWGFMGPIDYQQKEMVRMLYIHVPSAWFALLCYGLLATFSLAFLVTRHGLWDHMAFSIAKVGTVLTSVCLITGSLWGKPMWGTYWAWDARLTSVAVLQFLYVGYWAFRQNIHSRESIARIAAIIALLGAINLPVIKWSVSFWSTLHQGPSVFRMDGPQIDPAFLAPLSLTVLGLAAYVLATFGFLLKTSLLSKRKERTNPS